MAYHVDRLHAAVTVLAGHGHIKQRLISAYERYIDSISDEELPVCMLEAVADLRDQMYRVAPLNGEGPICASVRKMSIEEASACAALIIDLYREVLGQAKRAQTPTSRAAAVINTVPPFLVKTN